MRTDQTAICPACFVRFSRRAPGCPGCGRRDVGGLDARANAAAVADGSRRTLAQVGERARHDRGMGIAGAIAVSSLGLCLVHVAFAIGIAGALGYLLWAIVEREGKVVPADAPVRFLQLAAPAVSGARGTSVVGRLRVVSPIASPLSGRPCGAFRIAGNDQHGNAIDDAAMGELEVVTAEGERVRLLGVEATIDIETAPIEAVSPHGEMWPFLAARGLGRALVALGEGLLVDGDEVEVSGEEEKVAAAAASGYRDTQWGRALTEGPDAPLVLRRAR